MKPKPEIETRKLTEIVFILDRSGSMEDLTQDTIGGFNSMIQKQKDQNVNAIVSTVLLVSFINNAFVMLCFHFKNFMK